MHRAALSLLPALVLAALATFGTRAIVASDTLMHLTGWAEIPSAYRHPGLCPVSLPVRPTASRLPTPASPSRDFRG